MVTLSPCCANEAILLLFDGFPYGFTFIPEEIVYHERENGGAFRESFYMVILGYGSFISNGIFNRAFFSIFSLTAWVLPADCSVF